AEDAGLDFLSVGHLETPALRQQHACIAYLTAGLGIEGGGVKYHDGVLTGGSGLDRAAINVNGGDAAVGFEMFVALEAGVVARIRETFGNLELAGGAGLLALLLHGRLETVQVDLNLALAADVGCEIDWKAVGV